MGLAKQPHGDHSPCQFVYGSTSSTRPPSLPRGWLEPIKVLKCELFFIWANNFRCSCLRGHIHALSVVFSPGPFLKMYKEWILLSCVNTFLLLCQVFFPRVMQSVIGDGEMRYTLDNNTRFMLWRWSDPAVACCAGHTASSSSLHWWKQFHLSSSTVYQNKTNGRTLSASALSGTLFRNCFSIPDFILLNRKTSRGTLWQQINNINGPSWTHAPMMQITADMMMVK